MKLHEITRTEIFYKSLGEEAGVVVYEDHSEYLIYEIPQYGGDERLLKSLKKIDVTKDEAIKIANELANSLT